MKIAKKKFDAVAMMREIRDAMSAEMEDMEYEEQKQYLSERIHIKRPPETRERELVNHSGGD